MADERAIAAVLAEAWGCGPGEYIIGDLPNPDTGDAEPAPAGQMCRSTVHTHAYWDGTCEFATLAARAVLPAIPGDDAARALDEVLAEIRQAHDDPEFPQHLKPGLVLGRLIIEARAARAADGAEAGR